MKAKDIIKKKDIPDDECDVCMLHEKAYKILKDEILCPKCNKPLIQGAVGQQGFVVVGEDSGYDKNQNIGKYPLYHCDSCGNDYGGIYALMPVPIIYNGNHDIFYTGGREFLTDDTKELYESVKKNISLSIEQYTQRIRNGEKGIDSWNLLIWIQGDIENSIASFLYDNGYKK